jgi:ELWxxDGT repeat protein
MPRECTRRDARLGTTLDRPALTVWRSACYLTNVDGTLYFTANDGTSGYELWKSDGTEAGALRVKDIRSGAPSSGAGTSRPRAACRGGPPHSVNPTRTRQRPGSCVTCASCETQRSLT